MISVKLLDEPSVFLNGEHIIFPYKKAEGLFYYICHEKKTTRDKAAHLLWADNDEQAARKNLRNAIYQIRKMLGQDILILHGNTMIELNQDMVHVDIDDLNETSIIEKYEDTFLGRYYIKNCVEYEYWVEKTKAFYRQMYIRSIHENVNFCARTQDFERLSHMVERFYIIPILEENIYRSIMMVYYTSGHYNDALRIYQNLQELLRRELECEPESETTRLYEEIKETKTNILSDLPIFDTEYFYGRSAELYTLGHSRNSLFIVGDAGVGKTRLLSRFSRSVNEKYVHIIQYVCCQSDSSLPFRPFFEICESLQRLTDHSMLTQQILDNFYKDAHYSTKLELIAETLIHHVILQTGKKIILIIDDFQWMDLETANLLGSLIHHTKNEGIRILLASRAGYQNEQKNFIASLVRNHLLEILELEPFTKEDTDQIMAELIPEKNEDLSLHESVYEMTKGNAFFLMEILNLIKRNEDPRIKDKLFRSSSVVNIMDSRLVGLNSADRKILEGLSCQVEFLTFKNVQRISGFSELQLAESLERFIELQLISEEETFAGAGYVYKHRLIQDYIYSGLTSIRKMITHRMIAESIEEDDSKDVRNYPYLIFHYEKSGNLYKMYEYKLEYFLKYYSLLHGVYPNDAEYYENTSPWTRQLINETAVEKLVEEIRDIPLNGQDEERTLRLHMKSEFLYGRYAIYSGKYEEGLEAISKCESIAERIGDTAFDFLCTLQRIFYSIQIGHYEEMKKYLISIEERSKDNLLNRATYFRLLGLFQLKTKDYVNAEKSLNMSVRTFDMIQTSNVSAHLGRAACYNYIGEIYFEKEDYQQALIYFNRAIRVGKSTDETNGNAIFYVNLMKIMYCQGNFESVKQYAELAKGTFARTGAIWGVDEMEVILCMTCITQKEMKEAKEHLEEARYYAKLTRYPKTLKNIEVIQQYLEHHSKEEKLNVQL